MGEPYSRPSGYGTGFAFGVAVALAFAVVIRFLPSALFTDTAWLALALLIAGPLLAPPTVLAVWQVARWRGTNPTVTLVAAGTGAMAFDGLALSFVPALYGQAGDAVAGVGAVLLVAFASLGVAGYVMTTRRTLAAAARA